MNSDTPREFRAEEIAALCQQYLTLVYNGINTTFHKQHYTISQTSGEILPPSIDKLLTKVTLTKNDILMDLGSGLGRTLIYFFLKTVVKEARGIEIIPALYECSVQAIQRIKQELPEFFANERRVTFVQGDFLKVSLADVTVVFLCSTCFSQEMLLTIGEIIENTPAINTVMTLRPINSLRRLCLAEIVSVECSWSSALCYIYRD